MKRLRDVIRRIRHRHTSQPAMSGEKKTEQEVEQDLLLRVQAGIALNKTPPR